MKGVDISHYQKNLTIRQIRNVGYDFAVIKLTEGSWFTDAAAFDFYREALELKFPVGCYCYSHAVTPDEAREEAQFLLQAINRFPMPCGIYLDVEEPKQLELSDRQLRDMAEDWCDVIRSAGYTPGLYGSAYTLWNKLKPDELDADVLIWAAHYGKEPAVTCDLWQSSDSGQVGSYDGPVDVDEVRSARFKALVQRGYTAQEEQTGPDATVAVLQLLMSYDGCWETADGIKSPAFFKKLREFIDRLENG